MGRNSEKRMLNSGALYDLRSDRVARIDHIADRD